MNSRTYSHKIILLCGGALLTLASFGITNIDSTGNAYADTVTMPQSAQTTSAVNNKPVNDSTVSNATANQPAISDTTGNAATHVYAATSAQTTPAPNQPIHQVGWNVNSTNADAVDLSWMNGNMNEGNFVQLRNQGVKYVMIQLTKGTYMKDPYAAEQVRDAYAAGFLLTTSLSLPTTIPRLPKQITLPIVPINWGYQAVH